MTRLGRRAAAVGGGRRTVGRTGRVWGRTLALVAAVAVSTLSTTPAGAQQLLVPMDRTQTDHLRAYGLTFWVLERGETAEWLLNYRAGSFLLPDDAAVRAEASLRGVRFEAIGAADVASLRGQIADGNMEGIPLEKAPRIAVYTPPNTTPWDDAVTMALEYADIPYDKIWDAEVLDGGLSEYDWLHLHHEDFTGQYGKFASYRNQAWYIEQKQEYEELAAKHGFRKVSQLKLAVVKKIQAYTMSGGFLFAMCSATDTYDIALAAEGIDIVDAIYDGDPSDPAAQSKLNFDNTLAFKDFTLVSNPYIYEYSSIDNTEDRKGITEANDYFNLFEFSAKWDPIPTMLTQNHTNTIKAFMGQTTAFKMNQIKSDVVIMAENKAAGEARYIHGTIGKGFWTFYGGHDPEDYQHFVGEPPTDLNLFPNSPGYRLILNNILFPAAKKQKKKT